MNNLQTKKLHRTRDGGVLPIEEMSDEHLKNTIVWFTKKYIRITPYLTEANKRKIVIKISLRNKIILWLLNLIILKEERNDV